MIGNGGDAVDRRAGFIFNLYPTVREVQKEFELLYCSISFCHILESLFE